MFSERQTAMMATLVSGCVWKRLFSFLLLDRLVLAMGVRNGMLSSFFLELGGKFPFDIGVGYEFSRRRAQCMLSRAV